MATTLGNGSVIFGDGTQIASAVFPYGNITNPKTALSQFTNDLGNYGGYFTGASINTTQISTGAWASLALVVTGNTISLATNNCNCNCVCNC